MPSRRKLLRMASGAGASILVLPELAAADSPEKGERSSDRMTRAEKAAEEGKEWDESWINEDRIDETWANVDSQSVVTVQDQGARRIGGTIGFKGISITIEAYLAECEGWVEVGALGQTQRLTVTCSETCRVFHFDAGAAYFDIDVCVNWDTKTITAQIEGCVWHLTDWSCGSMSAEFS